MKIIEKPKKYDVVVLDHAALDGPAWWDQEDMRNSNPKWIIERCGWIIAEDKYYYLMASARVYSEEEGSCMFSDVWSVVKGAIIKKRLVKNP